MDEPKEKQFVSAKLLQRIIFDWMLLIGLYLSFVIFTAIDNIQYIWRSLTGVGWRVGEWGKLGFYVVFTIGFFVYQTRLFTKQSNRKHRLINWMMYIGAFFLLIGSCTPVSSNRDYILDKLHGIFCTLGTVTMAVSIGLMVLAYCRETKTTVSSKAMVAGPYFGMIIIGTIGLFTTGSPGVMVSAMFSLMATFMAMVYIHYFTVCFELAPKKD